MRSNATWIVFTFIGALAANAAIAGSIGVNFNASAAANVDNVTGTAGTVPQGNWNNAQGRSGTFSSGAVIDDNGMPMTGVSVSWLGDAALSLGNTAATGEGDDTALMHGGLESRDTAYTGDTEISLTDIPYTRYNLYLYVNGWDAGNRDGEIQLVVGGDVVLGSLRPFDTMGIEFDDGTHSHSESTGDDDEGTYVLWENLTAADVTAQVRKINSNVMIAGLQIVEVAAPDVSDQNIGVNFNPRAAAAIDPVTGVAGAIPQTNWNNVSDKTGAVTGAVLEASGATLEGMSVSWSGNAAHSVLGGAATGEGDDTALMHGGLEAQVTAYSGDNEISLTGIPYAEYDLYLYFNGWNAAERDGEAQLLVSGSAVPESQRQFDTLGADFIDGTHSHSESTGAADVGTYVLWEDLSATDLVAQVRKINDNVLITGLQLVKTPPKGMVFIVR